MAFTLDHLPIEELRSLADAALSALSPARRQAVLIGVRTPPAR